jgi:hypothetical protein
MPDPVLRRFIFGGSAVRGRAAAFFCVLYQDWPAAALAELGLEAVVPPIADVLARQLWAGTDADDPMDKECVDANEAADAAGSVRESSGRNAREGTG